MDMPPPPVMPPHAVVESWHGIDVVDPYRHLEDMADPAVQTWARGQADHAEQVLGNLPGRDRLRGRIDELAAGAAPSVGAIERLADGSLVYFKQPADADVAVVVLRDASGHERVILDPAALSKPTSGGHLSVGFFRVSPDGSRLLYSVAASGSEEESLRVRDIATGHDLNVIIDHAETVYAKPSWLPGTTSLVSSHRQPPEPGAPAAAAYRYTQAFLTTLAPEGECASRTCVFGQGAAGSPPLEAMDFPAVVVTPGSAWVIGQVNHGDEADLSLWALPLADLGTPTAQWQPVCTQADLVTDFAVHGDDIYLVTAKDAARSKVLRTSLAHPDLTSGQTIVPAGETVVTGVTSSSDALAVAVEQAAVRGILRVPYDRPQAAAMITMPPDEPSAMIAAASADMPGLFVRGGSWIRTGRIHELDPATASLTDTGLVTIGPFDAPDNLVATEVLVESHDGVAVPLSIVHRKDLRLDGTHPAILSGYGAYGHSLPMQFTATNQVWLERGGVVATAHVRGGGTFGKPWHHDGRKTTKPNTWKDFLACAEYLCREGYTSPDKLAARGGSAGGILIGRAITERPDCFVAANIAVGCTDMIRFETTRNGPPNIPEFGTRDDPEEFRGLLAMSTLHNIVDGTPYPAVILTHGINDPRVEPWQSFKTTARLQAATSSGRPVLLRIDYEAGHGIGSTRSQRHAEMADVQAFFLWQCGDPEFQPAAPPVQNQKPATP